MRKILLLLFLLLNLSSPAFATNWCESANIHGCWTIEEGSGTSTADVSSNSYDGSFKGKNEPEWSSTVPTTGFNGSSSYSVDFDGYNDYISVGTGNALSTFTMVVWFYADKLPINTENNWIISRGGTTPSWQHNYQLGLSDPDGATPCVASVEFYDTTGGTWRILRTSTQVYTGSYNHYAGSWDNSTKVYAIYFNGVATTNTSYTTATPNTASLNLNFGNNPEPLDHIEGKVDEIAIFSSALSSTDINDIMDNGLVQAGRRMMIIQ